MTRKEEDSVVNLTKPTLYSIYDSEVTRSEQDYNSLKQTLSHPKANPQDDPSKHIAHHRSVQIISNLISLLLLFWIGVAFAKLSTEFYDNHNLKRWMLSFTLSSISNWVKDAVSPDLPSYLIYGLLGIICGVSVPLVDKYIFHYSAKKNDNELKSILKCLNSMFGICLGIRTIQWSTSLQAATAWGLLNIILWLFFDGTKTILSMGIFTSGISVFITSMASQNYNNSYLPWFYILYIIDFYFFSFLIFGKLGRYLLK